MIPNSRRSLLNYCLLMVLLVTGIADLNYLSRKVGARFVAPVSSKPVLSERLMPAKVQEAYGRLPLSFETNQGQTDSSVKFLSRGNDYALFLMPTEAVLRLGIVQSRNESNARIAARSHKSRILKSTVLRMKFVGANPAPQVSGADQLPGKSNYFIGNDPAKWRTNFSNYARVKYEAIYHGVDLVMYGNQRQLEYDFVVAPGADPHSIRLAFAGARQVRLDAGGDLLLRTRDGELRQHTPVVYQEAGNNRQLIGARYVLRANNQIGFEVDKYDPSLPLIIDPVLSYSTFLGGSLHDSGRGIAVDADGNAYMTGEVCSQDFPISPGAYKTTINRAGTCDAFVTKLNSSGTNIIYSTYLAGDTASDLNSTTTSGAGIAVDSTGNAYVTGQTNAPSFPTTPGAFQPSPPTTSTVMRHSRKGQGWGNYCPDRMKWRGGCFSVPPRQLNLPSRTGFRILAGALKVNSDEGLVSNDPCVVAGRD